MEISAGAWHLRMIRFTFGFTPSNLCIYFWSMVMATLMIWPVGLVKLLASPMTPLSRLGIVGLHWETRRGALQRSPPDQEEAYAYSILTTGLMLIAMAFFLSVVARQNLDWVANLFFGLGSLAGLLVLIFVVAMPVIGIWKPVDREKKPSKQGAMQKGALAFLDFLGVAGTAIASPFLIFWAWIWAVKHRICPFIFVVERH